MYPTAPETILLSERFGDARAQELLYLSGTSTGEELRTKGWTSPTLPAAEVEAAAQNLAASLSTKSRDALRLLKQHLTRHVTRLVDDLVHAEAAAPDRSSDTVATPVASPAKHIHLETLAEGVLGVTFGWTSKKTRLKDLVADLGRIVAEAQQAGYRALVLGSASADFLPPTERAISEDVVLDCQRLLVESEIPVVAALAGHAKGTAWLIGQCCDACVYSHTGVYSSAGLAHSPVLAQTAAAVFTHRFGSGAGKEILLTGADYSGADLKQRVGTLRVAAHDQVLSAAIHVATSWATLPPATVAAWKRHTATTLQQRIRHLPAATGWEQKDEAPEWLSGAPTPVPLRSQVVTATAHPEGIVVVKMEDRDARNMFSEAFLEGVEEAFAHIEQTPAYKVVILTGYDSYFASGGTRDNLLAIQQGKSKFTDIKTFQLALDCKLPVIAAMQGHAIGGGWSLGMFADLVLVSEESRYMSPYMDYGFTPGAGATFILADTIGHDLARESLLTAQPFAGSQLRERGLSLPIVPRADMYAAAMALARHIAHASRGRLMGLKQQLTAYVHQQLEETYRLELAMHDTTFVGQGDALAQIENNFSPEVGRSPAREPQIDPAPPAVHVAATNRSADEDGLATVTATLKALLAEELQMRESEVGENVQFVDLGLDSISAVAWVRRINETYRTSIEATKVYSYPTLTELGRYAKEEAEKQGTLPKPHVGIAADMPAAAVGAASESTSAPAQAVKTLTSRRTRTPRLRASATAPSPEHRIAVIGMAGQFPQARNVEEFWRNIADGRNCISQVPPHRWDVQAHYQPGDPVEGKANSKWLGALDEYDLFDPSFFNISPTEAESMDPQQRLFLQACWHSIEHAGYDPRAFSGSKSGVFAGCITSDYHQASPKHELSAHGFTGSAPSILAARISYFLNLQGPCLSIDTACSSSLVAIAQACDSLMSGGSDVALAGGVYVMGGPGMHIKTSQAGMLSPEGQCFTFDQRADGMVPGEGVGVVLLKRLADAQRDRDMVHAVIQGWGVNQDGKTNGITAPNPESQTRLEQAVYDKHQIDPASIQLIEAHGTGTKLGDPIEVDGLKNAFKKYTRNTGYCALGSVKSNIGHCLAAAGIAGFIKLVLALKHEQLPPTINFDRLNEHIDLRDTPFYVNTRLQAWERGDAPARLAAISSFGFSGTNAHVVVGECLAAVASTRQVFVATPNAKAVIPLSARTAEQLQQKARDLLDFLHKDAQPVDLHDMAYTLQVGRTPMDERLAFLVSSVDQLADRLQAYVAGERRIEDMYQGQVRRNNDALSLFSTDADLQHTIEKWIAEKKLSKLLDLWVRGLELDWNTLYEAVTPQRISLPAYPFAKERYWIEAEESRHRDRRESLAGSPARHPLLHSDTSDPSQQRYSTTLTGDELFLRDHRVRTNGRVGQRVLPGVAYLEMARAAIEHASPLQYKSGILELRDTVWLKPVVVTEQAQVSIALTANGDGQIDYAIYRTEAGTEAVNCQGQAVFRHQAAPERIDLEPLKRQMKQGRLEASDVYATFASVGVDYGPAHQGIVVIDRGENQLLAELRIPTVVDTECDPYVLHPSVMDSALQASIGLFTDAHRMRKTPFVPFALDCIRIVSPCSREMIAWMRCSEDRRPSDDTMTVDVDLCDQHGNVCVQLRGFAVRALEREAPSPDPFAPDQSFDSAFYEQVIADVLNREVSVDEAVELG